MGDRDGRHDVGFRDGLGSGWTLDRIPFGIACGLALGLVNGIGVAYLRSPR